MGKGRTDTCVRCDRTRRIKARGLCNGCYDYEWTNGNLDRWTKIYFSPEEHFAATDTSDPHGCWAWAGPVTAEGYGAASHSDRAHRWVYALLVGPIPEGLDLDHECHNRDRTCTGGSSCLHRRCVNPAHLAPKSRGDNTRASALTLVNIQAERPRLMFCPKGHAYDDENTYVNKQGHWNCRTCQRLRASERRRQNPRPRKPAVTQCFRGHLYDEPNTYINPNTGRRTCRACAVINELAYRARRKARESDNPMDEPLGA